MLRMESSPERTLAGNLADSPSWAWPADLGDSSPGRRLNWNSSDWVPLPGQQEERPQNLPLENIIFKNSWAPSSDIKIKSSINV